MTAISDTRESRQGVTSYWRVWQALRLAALGAVAMLAAQTVFAQGYGRITGIVTDPAGAAVPNAKITVTQVSTGETTTTTTAGDGTYAFPSLRPARYNVSASGAGFATYVQTNLLLQADESLTVNIGLKVGAVNETVTVEANAIHVDTSSATISQVVDQRRITDLPLLVRNAASLTTLVAGVVLAPSAQADQGQTKTFPTVVAVTANGSRIGQMSYMLDGGNNVDEYTNVNAPFPFPDALQEFSVQTSNYNAEYGQNAGGVVNIVTKSGGSAYHGDVFEFNRNAVLNASNWFSFANGKRGVVDPLKRNQFGGTLGGPFKLPGVSTPHSFFFVGYQGTIVRDSPFSSSAASVPTAAQRSGTFNVPNAAGCLNNPFTGVPYPCTAVGSTPGVSTIDPLTYNAASLALLNHLPAGDASGSVIFQRPTRQNFNEFVGRFDQEIRQKDKLNVRYFYDRFHSDGVLDLTNLLTYSDQATINYQNALVSETHTFSDHLLNSFILSWQEDFAARGPLPGGISVADLGVNMWQPAFKQINQIQVASGFTIGDNPAATFERSNYTMTDDLHWVKGPHNIAFGAHGEFSKVVINNQYRQPGTFTFNAQNSNNSMASFLLGYLANFQQASGQFFNNRGKIFGFYVQDSWKANRRLTLNLGLRYEPFFPWHEIDNRMGAFSPSAFAAGTHSIIYPNAPAGLLFPGDAGMLRYGIRSVFTDFMPRVGFAWDLFGDGKTSLRGGAGIFYDTRLSSVFNNIYTNSSPFITNVSVNYPTGGFSNPYAGMTNPFPAQQPPPSTFIFPTGSYLTYDPYHQFQEPVSYSWNLAVERQITTSALARIAYVGSRSNHLWVPIELNPTTFTGTGASARIYAPTYTQQITEAQYSGNASYHSMQLSFEQRLRRGLTVLANYTWSKALDDLPWGASVTAIGTNASYVMPIYASNYKQLDFGPSDFDHRHVFSLSYVWEMPKLHNGWRPLRYIVNDWQTSGILQARSGDPLTITSSSSDNSKTGQNRDRAVMTGTPYGSGACAGVTSPCEDYLLPSSFSVNPLGTFGNAVKGSIVGPGYFNWDVSMMRHFTLTEHLKGEFRVEYFNVLNHPNFGDPATGLGGNFGRITSTCPNNANSTLSGAGAASTSCYDPRIGQLSLKLLF
jgi:hypothetical protein